MFWHCIWHSFWHIYSDILSAILSGILSGIYFDILSGIYADILSGIYAGILSGIFSGIRLGIWSGIYSGILSAILFLFGLLSSISLWHEFGSRRTPQHRGLAIWCSGPAHSTASRVQPRWQKTEAEVEEEEEGEGEEGEQGEWASCCTFVKSLETLTRHFLLWFPVDLFHEELPLPLKDGTEAARATRTISTGCCGVQDRSLVKWWSFACRKGLTLQDLPLMEPELMLHGWTIKLAFRWI